MLEKASSLEGEESMVSVEASGGGHGERTGKDVGKEEEENEDIGQLGATDIEMAVDEGEASEVKKSEVELAEGT